MNEKYYEVEGAVFRKKPDERMEIYSAKAGDFKPYEGDALNVYERSHPMTLEEVKPYMTAPAMMELTGAATGEAK